MLEVLGSLGGGAVGLVYHVKTNLVFPRGQNAFDGWSILFYEAWASDRTRVKALWKMLLHVWTGPPLPR